MSSFSLFVLILVIVAAVLGWRSGLIKQIGQVAGVIIGIAACRIFGPVAVAILCEGRDPGTDTVLYTVLAYVLLFVLVYLAVSLVGSVIRKILKAVSLGFVDRLGGAVFRVVEWLMLLSLALNLWTLAVPQTDMVNDEVFASILAFGPYLLGTESAVKLISLVSSAIGG